MMKRMIMILAFYLSVSLGFAQSADELKNAGNKAFEAKNYKNALENYEKAMAAWGSEPQNYVMIYNAGASAYRLKQYSKAIKYFDMVIANHNQTEPAFIYKAMATKMMKDKEATIKTYEEGLVKNPESASLKDGLAKFCRAEGKNHYIAGTNLYKATVAKVNAQKMKPGDPAYAAETDKAKKEFNAGIEMIDKCLSLDPSDNEAKQVKTACEQSLKAIQ